MRALFTALALLLMTLVMAAPATATKPDPDHKVGICHRTASDTNPYVYIEVDEAALDAHFNNLPGHPAKTNTDGSPRNDYLAPNGKSDCEEVLPSPTPIPTSEPSPTTTPTPTPEPSPTPTSTPTASPEPTPTVTPTPSPTYPTPTPPGPTYRPTMPPTDTVGSTEGSTSPLVWLILGLIAGSIGAASYDFVRRHR